MNWANGGITLFRSSKLMISVISAILTLSWFDCVESNERKRLTRKDDDIFLRKRKEEKRSSLKFYANYPCDFNFWTFIPVCIDFSVFFLLSEVWNIFFYVTIPEIGRWSSDTLNEDADKDTVYLVYSQKKVEWRVFAETS